MIIESGTDIAVVFDAAGLRSGASGVWLVTLDERLSVTRAGRLADSGTGTGARTVADHIADHVDCIAQQLADPFVRARYYALAWRLDAPVPSDELWLEHLDLALRTDPDLQCARLLGQLVLVDGVDHSTLPDRAFELHPHLLDLPRTLSIPGPHDEYCSCVICASERHMLDEHEPWSTDDLRDEEPVFPHYHYGSHGSSRTHDGPDLGPWAGELWFDPDLHRWVPDPARARRRWTVVEETTALRWHAEGKSAFEIAEGLLRQPGAVRKRLALLRRDERAPTPPVVAATPRAVLEAMVPPRPAAAAPPDPATPPPGR